MTEQNSDSKPEKPDLREWVNGQSLRTLDSLAWELLATQYNARLAAAATPEERKAIIEEYEGPDEADLQELEDRKIDPTESEITAWLSDPENVRYLNQRLQARRATRDLEVSKGEAELIPREVVQKAPPVPELATREAPTGIDNDRKDNEDIAEYRGNQELVKRERGLALLRDGKLSRASRHFVADVIGTLMGSLTPVRKHPDDEHLGEVANRRALAKQNLGASTKEMCKIYDLEGFDLPYNPAPGKRDPYISYRDLHNKAWQMAYKDKNCRPLLSSVVTRDKKA